MKDLHRTSHALKACDGVVRSILLPTVQERIVDFLKGNPVAHTARVRLVGVGIGPFSRSESLGSFLQMSTLLALRDTALHAVEKVYHLQQGSEEAAAASGQILSTTFFDPLSSPLHHRCCEALGVTLDNTNAYGAYGPCNREELVVAFMPHCPWVLLHNMLAHNWPKGDEVSAPWRLRQLILVVNDLREAPTPLNDAAVKQWCVYHKGLTSSLAYIPLKLKRRRGDGRRPADSDDEYDVSLSGVSAKEVLDAFSDTAVMWVKPDTPDAELCTRLATTRRQKLSIIKCSPELFD